MTHALVVAGGAGERMRRSGASTPKPLVQVAGRTLLEHNVTALLAAGFTDIHVAVSVLAPTVRDHAVGRCAPLVEQAGGSLEVIVEDPPLGSLGAAALVDAERDLLVVNADNLTALDLREVVAAHRRSGAEMTIAVHDEPFAMPFGEITLDGDRVVAYREKPTYRITICSAVTVLAPRALGHLTAGTPTGLPQFANHLLELGCTVNAFRHDAPWVDVNDLSAAERAEQMLAETPPTILDLAP